MVVLVIRERNERKREYRTFTPKQKAETVLTGLRGDRAERDVWEHGASGFFCCRAVGSRAGAG